ncbi:MAG TPA: acetyl-CoA carboxylase biotin carboxylase subunit [Ktedonobacteraceae bacterium]|jgi:3-methylcrotonyl-CoA carboxylase alpha subunit
MFNKILIANRGEIAVRIMATCHEMDIHTVAVYSEADRNALHVHQADEAYYIGPAPAAQSYLQIDTIIDIARRSGAQAIHPGYGFLSENEQFVEACKQAGIVFVGPPAAAMRLMGSKIAAKRLANSVGVPTVPGYDGASQDDEILLHETQQIGFPLLIKASAGGGGKGMRAVSTKDNFLAELAGARREARAAFGDDTVFLERLIQRPRHIEIQILGDAHGNLIHLGERECSIQRRHQKIVEESPSVAISPTLRAEMGDAALRIARAAGYMNAGTIEFMLDEDQHFYFLEMNTRLQVEHPVTEQVTGLDLVRHQLHIAAGEPLGIAQEQISQRGHSIEVRIYAEDAQQQFLPSTGIITRFVKPSGPGIRIDSGVESGDEITQYYDPMIAKLIVYGEDRPAAITRLQKALEQCAIFGVTTNIPLLHTISTHSAFNAGNTSTSFLEEYKLTSLPQDTTLPDVVLMAAALFDLKRETTTQSFQSLPIPTSSQAPHAKEPNPWQTLGPWRTVGEAWQITYQYADRSYKLALQPTRDKVDTWTIQIDTNPSLEVTGTLYNDALVQLKFGASQVRTYVQQQNGETQVVLAGKTYRLQRRQPPDVRTTTHGDRATHTQKTLTAPMAGTVVKVLVSDGTIVEPHQVLVVLNAMKMEHAITAPYAGKVRHVLYQEGAVVKGGAVLAEME